MQISSNYSMNGVPYENRRRQNDIPQFSTERAEQENCLLYTSPSPRDRSVSRMPSSA